MRVIDQIQRERRFFATCPSCSEEFRLDRAVLFHVKEPLPPGAMEKLDELRAAIRERKDELAKRRKQASEKAKVTTESVNVGKVVEKIAPSFSTFPFAPRDCRALLEPIDYLVFSGLSRRGQVESLRFVEVKSGGATLNDRQRQVRDAVTTGKVSVEILRGRA